MIALRPATEDDRERLLALLADERIAASLSTAAPTALEDALDTGHALVIDADGSPAGVVCWSSNNRRSRIAGIHTVAVDPAFQGRGIAVAALRELVRHLLENHDFHRVEAEAYGFNTAARRAFVAAGFTEEGIRRRAYDRHGEWQDGVHLGLVAG